MATQSKGPSGAGTRLANLERESDEFSSRFVRVAAASVGVIAAIVTIAGIVTKISMTAILGGLGAATCASCYVLTLRGNGLLGRRLFVYGMLGIIAYSATNGKAGDSIATQAVIACFLGTLAAFALPRTDQVLTWAVGGLVVGGMVVRQGMFTGWDPQITVGNIATIGLMGVDAVAVSLFTAQARENQRKLHSYVVEVDRAMGRATRIAQGDLSGEVEGAGEMTESIRAMLEGLRTLVTRTRDATTQLASAAGEIAAMARQQEHGATEQASAVTEVHRTLATLAASSSHAAASTEEVFRNVELTQKTSEVVAQRASALSVHTRRIAAILEIIKNIANKSEILALNAALEGARAGEAGRGFSLVASQMQRLAENVMDSIRDVRSLVEDIDAATSAMLTATEESTQLSSKSTAAARQISMTLQQQRVSSEQVAAAMQDIHQIATQVSAGSTQSLTATKDLTRMAEELKRSIDGFQL